MKCPPSVSAAAIRSVLALMTLSGPAAAQEPAQFAVRLQNHRFDPAEIHVPAGKPIILLVTNADDTTEEFDSTALRVEKLIVGGHYATIRVHPLAPGRYPFIGEFHPQTAAGAVVADQATSATAAPPAPAGAPSRRW